MKYVFDIDGTICAKKPEDDYEASTPIEGRIEKINKLYDEGNHITYFTARGMGRHNNNQFFAIQQFYTVTQSQLEKWGAKYHNLVLGKPSGDIYVDDKGMKDEHFFRN